MFTAQVTDSAGNTGSLAFTLKVLIFVSDAAPLAASPYVTPTLPNATAAIPYSNTLYETGAAAGPLTWSITAGALPPGTPGPLTLNTASGTVSGTPSTAGTYMFTAQVTDSAGNTGSLAFTLKVLIFVSDAAPLAASPYVTPTLPNATAAIPYTNTLYETGAAAAPLTWSITAGAVPPGMMFNTASGTVSGTPSTAGTYNFTVKATDSAGNTGSLLFTLQVLIFVSYNSNPPNPNGTLPTATAGIPYAPNPNAIQQYGAVGAVTWSYTPLPPGIMLNSGNGMLSGTPSTAGTYNFTVTATDSAGNTGSLLFTLQVLIFESDSNAPNVTTTLTPAATVGTPYSNTIDEDGGTAPLTWSITSGALPPGLSLGPNSGTVSGTPTAPGNYNFTVQVTDSASPPNVATLAFMLSVADAQYGDLIVVDGAPTASPLGGTLFRITPTGTSGTIAAISNGSPTGVAVDPNTGNIYVAADSVSGSGTTRIVKIGPSGAVADPFVPGLPAAGAVLQNPVAVAVDASGNVYVGDNGTNAIYEFNSSGTQVGAGPFASLPSSTNVPNHIRMAFDSSGNLDVASDNIGGSAGVVEVDQIASTGTLTVLYNTTTNAGLTDALSAVNASAAITSFAISSNVVTFQAVNNFSAGTTVLINGLTTGTYLDGQVLTVLSTGLSSTQFEANFTNPDVASTPDAGTATSQTAAYTGTFSPPLPVGSPVAISGFANATNNGTFTVVSCTSTTLVVNNPNGITETKPGTATFGIGAVGGIAVFSDGSIDVADYVAQKIYKITNPGAANMAITTAISAATAINPPPSPLCCNISGMANPSGAPTTLFVTLTGANSTTPQLQQAVPATSTVTTVNSTQTYTLTAASAVVSGNTTYTGTFSPAIPVGSLVTITGFTNATNNGTFTFVSCSSTQLVVNNGSGVAETNPGTAVTATPLTFPNDVAWYDYPPPG